MRNILVVDNDKIFLGLMSRLLEKEGHQVETAVDGLNALEILKTYTPDVLFVDLVMPNIGGRTLCKIIRGMEKFRNTPLIILSATSAEEVADFTQLDVNACIAKGTFSETAQNVLSVLNQSNLASCRCLPGDVVGIKNVYPRGITKELLSVNKHFEIILDRMSEVILEINFDGRIVYANSAAFSLIDIPEIDLLGLYFVDLFSGDDHQRISDLMKMKGAKSKEINEDAPVCLNRSQVTVKIIPLGKDESPSIIILHDVTERKKSEEALRESEERHRLLLEVQVEERTFELLRVNKHLEKEIAERQRAEAALRESEQELKLTLDATTDAVYKWNFKTDELIFSPHYYRMLGYEPGDFPASYDNWKNLIHPDDQESALRVADKYLETKPDHYENEFRLMTKTGEARWIHARSKVIERDERGDAVRLIGTHEDITERKQAEESLRKTQERLFQAQKMETLGVLVAGVAHEINNPINLIMYNVPLLQKIWRDIQPILEKHALHEPHKKYGGLTSDFLKQDLDKLIRDMDLAANRVARIVSGLKDFVKMSDIRDKMPIQINDAVTNAMRLAQTTLKKAGIDVELEMGQDLPLIEGNLQSLEQIVVNLIVNASQAIEHENGMIKVKTGLDEAQEQIVVVVSDNGKGIDPSIYGRIFAPFFTSRQADGGTGMGLAISYSIAKAHDGEITFESEVGRGTIFTMTLPTTLKRKRARILVADDEKPLRDIIAHALMKNQPYMVKEASTGTEALLKIGTFRPDLLILDVFMPDTDGLEVCRALKKDPHLSGIKVIIITGHAGDPKIDQIKRLGFEKILEKPLRMGDLLREVHKILGEGDRGNRQKAKTGWQ